MRRVSLLTLLIVCAVSLAVVQGVYAAEPKHKAEKAETMTGTIIDNMCAGANKDNIAEFIKTHPKDCVLKPACSASGYSFYSDGKLTKFDKKSHEKIENFLKKPESTLNVELKAKKAGDELHVVSIRNMKE